MIFKPPAEENLKYPRVYSFVFIFLFVLLILAFLGFLIPYSLIVAVTLFPFFMIIVGLSMILNKYATLYLMKVRGTPAIVIGIIFLILGIASFFMIYVIPYMLYKELNAIK